MDSILYIVTGTIRILITAMQVLMLVRAVLSWIPMDEEGPVTSFVYSVTEPVIMPVRALLDHFGWFEEMPIDMAFMITYFLLAILGIFL